MKKSLYSQPTCRTSASPQHKRPVLGAVEKSGRQIVGSQLLQHDEPDLPKGYRHIRDAIRALLTLEEG